MELDQVREKALSYQSILKYLEPKVEMKLLWRSCLDMGTCYIENISNTIRWNIFQVQKCILQYDQILNFKILAQILIFLK